MNRSQFVTGSGEHRDPRSLPYAFAEHGVAMLSSLRSERAIELNILIIRVFVRLREYLTTHKDLARKLEDVERTPQEQARTSSKSTSTSNISSSPLPNLRSAGSALQLQGHRKNRARGINHLGR